MSNKNATAPVSVQMVEVTEDQDGQRIDNFLRTALKGVPKSLIYRVLRKGELRVNKKRVKPEYRVQVGDLVRIPPIRVAAAREEVPVGQGLIDVLEASILYEDKDLIIINKPSGLAVHGGSGVSLGLIEALRQMRPEQRFMELVHRLDRDTSGCIMVAKKRSMLRYMHEALRQKGRITKIYHALVLGRWPTRKHQVDAPLNKNELKSGERVVKVHPMGKPSLTLFRVLRRFGSVATLVEAQPVTGRTHQIRVHAQFAGHPIVGDDKYGVDENNREMKAVGFRRLFLHAAELRLTLPSGERLRVEAPLESQLLDGLTKLQESDRDGTEGTND
ncbi:23S rRNA pseudouridine(955/2504/2580) synthase RluC [Marinobacterium aestuariivivens]|uniref:Pseudouridine synthase n=1 Tax=Marinobacterium aestuariivivens TaxID=1698799 RepID=A0ABW2A5J2_9GAMM